MEIVFAQYDLAICNSIDFEDADAFCPALRVDFCELGRRLDAKARDTSGAALEQPGAGTHHQPGERFVKLLSFDATRAAQVTTIMTDAQSQRRAVMESMKGKSGDPAAREGAHAQMKAIGKGTKGELAQVLSADELAKLK